MRANNLFLSSILGCVATFALAFPVHAQNWPTTKFVFQNVDPTSHVPSFVGELIGFRDKQKPVVAEYEKYLSQVAVHYQAMGFKAPELPITTSGEKAYIVYLYDYDDSEAPALAGHLVHHDIEPSSPDFMTADLRVDLSRAIVDGKPVDRTFDDLAHELFHNVQRAYQLSAELEHGSWILEGQAQALGMEAAKRLRGIDVEKGKSQVYWLGGRGYFRPLPTETHDENYRTASFWRYIGEHVAAAKTNGRAGLARIDPDYGYLAKIFNKHQFKGPATAAGDLKWLDNALEKEVGLGLDRLYPNFISTFAGYAPVRQSVPPVRSRVTEDQWLVGLFGLCPSVSLGLGNPSASVKAALRKNASRCFKADVSGTGRFDISMQVHADTAKVLEDLHIGVSGGAKVSSPHIVVSPVGGGYLGLWRFRVATAAPQVFIISNMAAEPAKSLHQDVVLNLTASQWNSSMTTPTPQAQPHAQPNQGNGDKKGGNRASGDATRQTNQDDIATGMAALSNQTAIGSRSFFNRNIDPCNQPFAVLGCGPNTSIQLALTPGVLGDLSQTSGTGGLMGQFISNMTSIADNGIAKTSEQLLAAQQKIISTEGAEVTIVIPAIEYGFTGSFSNAHISVSGANGAGAFESLDPRNQHIGHVIIEEFTPYALRGRFDAGLIRTSETDYTQVAHRAINGSFVVAAPWEGDRDVKIYRSGANPTGAVIQDVHEAIPMSAALDRSTSPERNAPSASTPYPAKRAAAFPSCNCSCQPIEAYDAVCRPICAVKVQQCAAQLTQQGALDDSQSKQAELIGLSGDVDRMRADFKEFLREKDESTRDALLRTFDGQPTPEAKRFMLYTFGMSIKAYGNR